MGVDDALSACPLLVAVRFAGVPNAKHLRCASFTTDQDEVLFDAARQYPLARGLRSAGKRMAVSIRCAD
jgi:hypothetical protein